MCNPLQMFGGGKAKTAINQANLTQRQSQSDAASTASALQQQETDRENRVRAGQQQIDNNFGQFNDGYFQNYANSVAAGGNADVDRNYTLARDKLVAALADRGVLDSTIAGSALGNLEETRARGHGEVADSALSAANDLRQRIQAAKTNLYGVNATSTNPDLIGAEAAGQGKALTDLTPAPIHSTGDIFASALSPFVKYAQAKIYSPYSNGKLTG